MSTPPNARLLTFLADYYDTQAPRSKVLRDAFAKEPDAVMDAYGLNERERVHVRNEEITEILGVVREELSGKVSAYW